MSDCGERRGSVSSSSSLESWTLLNHQGHNIDNTNCPTDLQPDPDIISDISEDECEIAPVKREISENSSIEKIDLDEEILEKSVDTVINGEDENESMSSLEDVVESCEFLPPRGQLVVDGDAVRRLLDALSNAVNNNNSNNSYQQGFMDRQRSMNQNQVDSGFSEELPVNFVQMASNRIKNYIHTQDSRLNWKLSLLLLFASATVLGLGIGHFIGTTNTWLRKHRMGKQQIEHMKGLQDGLVSCLANLQSQKAQFDTDVRVVQAELTRCRALETESCSPIDKPIGCPPNTCVQDMSLCHHQLKQCHEDLQNMKPSLNEAEEKRVENAFWDMEYKRLSDIQQKERANEIKVERLERIVNKKNEKLAGFESEIANSKTLSEELREKVNNLKNEAIVLDYEVIQLEKQLEKCQNGPKNKDSGNSGWDSVVEVLSDLRNVANSTITQHLDSYVKIIHNYTIFPQLNKLADNSKMIWKLESAEVTEKIGSYWQKARRISDELTSAVSKVVHEISEAPKQKDFTAQVEQLVRDLGRRVSIFGIDLDDRISAPEQSRIIYPDIQPTPLPSSPIKHNPSISNQQFTLSPSLTNIISPMNSAQKLWKGISNTFKTIVGYEKKSESENEQILQEMWSFRGALKKSNLEDVIGNRKKEQFIDYLRRLTSGESSATNEVAFYWKCQKKWWSLGILGNKCAAKQLTKWQTRHYLDIRGFLAHNPQLRIEVEAWNNKQIDTNLYGNDKIVMPSEFPTGDDVFALDDVISTNSDWSFERSNQRHKHRNEATKSDWMFERSKDRQNKRVSDQRGLEKSEWLFIRGKEREQQRKINNSHKQRIHKNQRTQQNHNTRKSRDYCGFA